MIVTLFFLQLIAFQVCYVTSSQVEHNNPSAYLRHVLRNKRTYRLLAAAIILLSTIAFGILWGWMSGICAGLVGLMGVGSLVVLLNPFRYVNGRAVVLLYAFFLALELFI